MPALRLTLLVGSYAQIHALGPGKMIDRVRNLGEITIRSLGDVSRRQRVLDNDAEFVPPHEMLAELRDDNGDLARRLREMHSMCDEHGDVASASLIEVWIDEAENRRWYLFEATR